MPLTLLDIIPSHVSMGVMLWHDTAPLAETCHQTHLGGQVEASNDLKADHSHTHLLTFLLTNWATGKTAAFVISLTSLHNTHTLMEAGVSAGSAALATEGRRHRANDAKCGELGWLCVPLIAEIYGAWGIEAIEAFSLGLLPLHAGPSLLHFQKSMAGSTSI